MNKYILFLSLLLVSSFAFFLPKPIFAQSSQRTLLRIDPAVNDLTLFPGKTTLLHYTIENISNNPLGIHVSLEGFSPDDENSGMSFDIPTATVLAQWARISEPDFILPENTKKIVSVSITPPANAQEKGYYGILFFAPIVTHAIDIRSPQVLSKVGSLILTTVGTQNTSDLSKKVRILDLALGKTPHGQMNITFRVQNDYFTHFMAKPFITIKPLFGKKEEFILDEKHVLPGQIRLWNESVELKATPLFANITLALSVGQGKEIFKQTYYIGLPIGTILFLISLGMVLLCIVILRGRFVQAFKILFTIKETRKEQAKTQIDTPISSVSKQKTKIVHRKDSKIKAKKKRKQY